MRVSRVSIFPIHADTCNESRTVLQNIFQRNVCNSNNFIVQTVCETSVQCDRHSDPHLQTTSLFTDAVINC